MCRVKSKKVWFGDKFLLFTTFGNKKKFFLSFGRAMEIRNKQKETRISMEMK